MKTYEQVKKELLERRKNIKGFNKTFYKQFCRDLEVARIGVEESNKLGVPFSVTEYWNTTETHKTWFYIHNGGAYCELLSIIR